jgi:hypothetical protein
VHEKIEDTKGLIRSRNSYKDRKCKGKQTNNGRNNTTHKLKDWATRTPLKQGMNSSSPEGYEIHVPQVTSALVKTPDDKSWIVHSEDKLMGIGKIYLG